MIIAIPHENLLPAFLRTTDFSMPRRHPDADPFEEILRATFGGHAMINGGADLLVAKTANKVIGGMMVIRERHPGLYSASGLCVAPAYRSTGVGTAVLRFAAEHYRSRGLLVCGIELHRDMAAKKPLERAGWNRLNEALGIQFWRAP